MTSLSHSTSALLQFCAPCQAAIRQGRISRIASPDPPNSIENRLCRWVCPLCCTINAFREHQEERQPHLILWIEKQLNRFKDRGIAENAPAPPIGDISDIILFLEGTQHSQTRCHPRFVAPSNIISPATPPEDALRVVPQKRIDTTLVKHWISYCAEHHPNCRTSADAKSRQSEFKLVLIDVKRRCLIRLTSRTRYLALSYVWGNVKQLQLTQMRLEELEKDHSLDRYWGQISRVLKDAIKFTLDIGETYLWSDTICIIHDSPGRYVDISRMNDIYEGAVCTLVAVDGIDASSPLPGVQAGSRRVESLGRNMNLNICRRRSELASIFQNSKYETRAWTFQERLLSSKCLYFTHEQLYFHCKTALWSEDRYEHFHQEPDPFGMYASLRYWPSMLQTSPSTQFESYVQLSQQYSRRQLSFSSDRLNAFRGIANGLGEEWQWDFVSGLPAPLLDLALLWVSSKQFPRRIKSNDAEDRLPSWSWTGRTDGIHYRLVSKRKHLPYLRYFTMTTPSGIMHYDLLLFKNAKKAFDKDQSRITKADVDQAWWDALRVTTSGPQARKEWWDSLKYDLYEKTPDPQKDFDPGSIPSNLVAKSNILMFTTESIPATSFTLFSTRLAIPSHRAYQDPLNSLIRRILDADEKACGLLAYSGILPQGLNAVLPSKQTTTKYEYILISKSENGPFLSSLDDGMRMKDGYEEEFGTFNVFDQKYAGSSPVGVFNVMLIEWMDEGFAERIAVGQIHGRAWREGMPKHKRIYLG